MGISPLGYFGFIVPPPNFSWFFTSLFYYTSSHPSNTYIYFTISLGWRFCRQPCARGESNPCPNLGRIKYYHYTTSAFSSVDMIKHWRESNPLLRFCRSFHKPLQCLFGQRTSQDAEGLPHFVGLPDQKGIGTVPQKGLALSEAEGLLGRESNPRYNVNSITFYH
jgi:hypothetical protein